MEGEWGVFNNMDMKCVLLDHHESRMCKTWGKVRSNNFRNVLGRCATIPLICVAARQGTMGLLWNATSTAILFK
jgi:hypothetical protein